MVSTRSGSIVLWPTYFDSRKKRENGRRVSKKLAVEKPSAEEIYKIARKLGFQARLEADKSHPRSWSEKEGRVLVEKGPKKTELIRLVATELRKANTQTG